MDFTQAIHGVSVFLAILLLLSSVLQFIYGAKSNHPLAYLCIIIALGFIKPIFWKNFYDNNLFLIFIGGVKEVFIGPLLLFHLRLKITKLSTQELIKHLCLPVMIYLAYIIKVLFYFDSHSSFNVDFYLYLTVFLFFHYIFYYYLSYTAFRKVSTLVISKVSRAIFWFLLLYIVPHFISILITLTWFVGMEFFKDNSFFQETIIKVWIATVGNYISTPLAIISSIYIFLYSFIEIPFFKSVFYPKNILKEENSQEQNAQIKERIYDYFVVSKKFKDSNLTLSTYCKELKLSKAALANYFKTIEKTTLNDYLNRLKVDEFKNLLSQDADSKFDINSIAEMSGFKSRATFYRIFKELEGITPTEYKKRNNRLD